MRRTQATRDAEEVKQLAEHGDAQAAASDGPVPPTWQCLTGPELERFHRCAYRLAVHFLDLERG